MDIPWEDVQLFLAIAETGSLSAAAKRLKIGQPTVSRRLAMLEDRLGYLLFRRDVSGARVTAEGERLVVPARNMAEWAGEIGRTASRGDSAPAGLVRIAAPPGVSFDFVAPFAGWLRQKHPQLRVESLSSAHPPDLARGEADLALRLHSAGQADLTTVASFRHRVGVFVSRDYAEKLPKKPRLEDIDWIAWAPPFEEVVPNPQLAALIPGFVPSFTADNYLVMYRAAEAGLGAMVLADVRHRFNREAMLVPLDVDLGPHGETELHVVCPKRALDVPRVRTVLDLLVRELERLAKSQTRT